MPAVPHVIHEGQSYRRGQFALPKYVPVPGRQSFRVYDPPEFMPDGRKTKTAFRKAQNKAAIPVGYGVNINGQQICGSWTVSLKAGYQSTDYGPYYCLSTDLATNGRCDKHGGLFAAVVPATRESRLAETAEYHAEHRVEKLEAGRYASRYGHGIPPRLLAKYEQSLQDPEFLSVADEMALLTARIDDLSKRTEKGEAGALWVKLRGLMYEYSDALDELKPSILKNMFSLIERGATDHQKWQDINATVELRRKLSETERKLHETKQQFITAQQAAGLVGGMANIVLKHVSDPLILMAIRSELAILMQRGMRHTPEEATASGMAGT